MHNVLRKEYFFICVDFLYMKNCQHICITICLIFIGEKCSYAYRFEEEGDTVGEDRAEAVKKS